MDKTLIEKEEKVKYASCWGTGKYAQSEQSYWIVEVIKSMKPKSKVLDLGCGNGFVVKRLVDSGIDAYGVDITNAGWKTKSKVNPEIKKMEDRLFEAPLWQIPFKDKEFEITFSTTVLEHIPPDMISLTLKEILRITNKKTIHYIDVSEEQKQFGQDLHLTVQSVDWWQQQFNRHMSHEVECIIRDKNSLTEAAFNKKTVSWYLNKIALCIREGRLPDFITKRLKRKVR